MCYYATIQSCYYATMPIVYGGMVFLSYSIRSLASLVPLHSAPSSNGILLLFHCPVCSILCALCSVLCTI